MSRHSEYKPIDAVSLHFSDGGSRIYTSKELVRLVNDLTLDISLEFAVVNFTNSASLMIIHDAQELFKFLGLKFCSQISSNS